MAVASMATHQSVISAVAIERIIAGQSDELVVRAVADDPVSQLDFLTVNGGTIELQTTGAIRQRAPCGYPEDLSTITELDQSSACDMLQARVITAIAPVLEIRLQSNAVLDKADAELAKGLPNKSMRQAWAFMVRYVAPPILLGVLYLLITPTWQAIRTLLGLGDYLPPFERGLTEHKPPRKSRYRIFTIV